MFYAVTETTFSASELELNNSATKVLSLYWGPLSDELSLKVCTIDDTSMYTNRTVLSNVATFYDHTEPVEGWFTMGCRTSTGAFQFMVDKPQQLTRHCTTLRLCISRRLGIHVGFSM